MVLCCHGCDLVPVFLYDIRNSVQPLHCHLCLLRFAQSRSLFAQASQVINRPHRDTEVNINICHCKRDTSRQYMDADISVPRCDTRDN